MKVARQFIAWKWGGHIWWGEAPEQPTIGPEPNRGTARYGSRQGLLMRRAVAHDRPRLGAFNRLLAVLSEHHQALRFTDLAIREARPTKYGRGRSRQ